MLIQIAILAVIFLGERRRLYGGPVWRIAGLGVLWVRLVRMRRARPA